MCNNFILTNISNFSLNYLRDERCETRCEINIYCSILIPHETILCNLTKTFLACSISISSSSSLSMEPGVNEWGEDFSSSSSHIASRLLLLLLLLLLHRQADVSCFCASSFSSLSHLLSNKTIYYLSSNLSIWDLEFLRFFGLVLLSFFSLCLHNLDNVKCCYCLYTLPLWRAREEKKILLEKDLHSMLFVISEWSAWFVMGL